MNLFQFVVGFFRTSTGNTNDAIRNMMEQLFSPFVKELRRFISSAYDEEPPSRMAPAFPAEVPASDRVVTIHHNIPEYHQFKTGLEGIEEQIRTSNSVDPETKERALAELVATRRLFDAESIRLTVATTLVLGFFSWIALQCASTIVDQLITAQILPSLKAISPGLFGR